MRIMLPIVAMLLLGGCSDPEKRRPPLVAVVMKSLANGFFVTMAEGAEADHAKRPDVYRIVLNGTRNESDLAQQVAIIDQMIAKNAQAIVIAPADSKAVVPALARAIKRGIVVINIDNRLDRQVLRDYGVSVPFIGPDNRAGAKRIAIAGAAGLHPGDQVAILEGITTADNSRARRMGLEDAARALGLDVVTEQSAAWDQGKAAELTTAILVRYPKLRAVLCANDNMALGATSAVGQAGKSKTVRVIGFDNIPAIAPLLARHAVTATGDQHADKLAVFGIDYALRALKGHESLPDAETPVDVITAPGLTEVAE